MWARHEETVLQQGCSCTGTHSRQFKSYVSTVSDKCDWSNKKKKKKKERKSGNLALHHSVNTSQKQRQCRQAYYRDMKEIATKTWNDIDLSLDGQDEDMVM